jgi:hypothetical protein
MRVRILFAAALAALALATPVTRVAACSCAGGTLEQLVASSDLAFTGVPIDAYIKAGQRPGIHPDDASLVYTFAVDGVIKGGPIVNRQIKVEAKGGLAGSCGIRFEANRRSVVLASANGSGWMTTSCSGSRPIGADEALPVAVTEPPPPSAADPVQELRISRRLLAAIGGGILLVGFTVWAFRREDRRRA